MRDLNRRANLERLSGAALALFLARGTEAVTIDQIVEAAAMAKGSFYRHARDKADLVAQIMAPVVGEVTVALDRCEQSLAGARADTLARIYLQLATDLAQVVAGHAPRVLLYLQEVRAPRGPAHRAVHAFAEQLTRRAVTLTEIARGHRLIRDVDPEVTALTVIGAVDALLFAYLRRGQVGRRPMPPTEVPSVISELLAIVLRGIGG